MIKKQKIQYLFGITLVLIAMTFVASFVQPQIAFAAEDNCNYEGSVISAECDTSETGAQRTVIWDILLLTINILTAGIGILAVGGVVYASIRYATAGGNTEQTKQAMKQLGNIAIGIIAYALMYSFLNFLIPGGLFS
jgi:hypothetical protein